MSQPFHRALQMMALISAAMKSAFPKIAMDAIGPYESRGKGGKKAHCVNSGAASIKRAAIKKQNIQRHRRANK